MWSRYALIAEVQTNEKALLETFTHLQVVDSAFNEAAEYITLLEVENKKLTERCAAQVLMLAALGEVEASKAGSDCD